jgi:hypothetical protein
MQSITSPGVRPRHFDSFRIERFTDPCLQAGPVAEPSAVMARCEAIARANFLAVSLLLESLDGDRWDGLS